MRKVAVLLVNRGQWELTERCIRSLMRSEGVEVHPMLVDNGSDGDVPDWVERIPRIRFHRAGENLGFAGGNNRAFSLFENGDIPWTFVLNNDTEVSPGSIAGMLDLLISVPEAGIVTPPIFFAAEPERIWSAGGAFSPTRMIFRQEYSTRGDLPGGAVETDFASGCAMLMSSDLYASLGGFREGFFIYHEDTVLCRECTSRGLMIYLYPDAEVLHHISVTSGGTYSPFTIYFTHRNRYLAARRILPSGQMTVFFLYYSSMTAFKTLLYTLQGRVRLVPWVWRAWFHGLAGREGGLFPALSRTLR